MRSFVFAAIAGALCIGGCGSFQQSYDAEARRQCREVIDTDERMDCLRQVDANSRAMRETKRSDDPDETTGE
ncbi:MAG: hypothetical protein R3C52_10925 [Hyphomonadaceae bacterium]